jgi:copper chaperone CopZ
MSMTRFARCGRVALRATGLVLAAALAGCASTATGPGSAPTPGALSEGVTIAPGETVNLTVWGMSCPKCAANVDQLVGGVPGVVSVHTDMANGLVTVETGSPAPDAAKLEAAIGAAGFTLMKMDVTGATG